MCGVGGGWSLVWVWVGWGGWQCWGRVGGLGSRSVRGALGTKLWGWSPVGGYMAMAGWSPVKGLCV